MHTLVTVTVAVSQLYWDRNRFFSWHWRNGHYRATRWPLPVIHWARRSGNFWVRGEVTGHYRTSPRRSNTYYNFQILISHCSNNCASCIYVESSLVPLHVRFLPLKMASLVMHPSLLSCDINCIRSIYSIFTWGGARATS